MKYQNIVIPVTNYATNWLNETLQEYGNKGFKLVNVVMAKNQYNCDIMYVFFTKEIERENLQ